MQRRFFLKIVIDLDGTICSEEKQFSRSLARPIEGAVESLKKLKSSGYHVIIYTARSWAEYEMTKDWLDKYKVPYDQLILGKPQGDFWVDDRAISFKDWDDVLRKIDAKN